MERSGLENGDHLKWLLNMVSESRPRGHSRSKLPNHNLLTPVLGTETAR